VPLCDHPLTRFAAQLVSAAEYDRVMRAGGSLAALEPAPEPTEEEAAHATAAAAAAVAASFSSALPQPVAPPAPAGPSEWGLWRRAVAAAGCYYYNFETGETTWTQPPGWGAPLPPPPPPQEGFYYCDLQGAVQGPFSPHQLAGWRAALPLELQVWWGAAGVATARPLAHALGDSELLALLRSRALPLPQSATAPEVEAAVAAAAAAAEAAGEGFFEAQAAVQAEEGEGGALSAADLAAAALAGLPEERRQEWLAAPTEAPAASREETYACAPVFNKVTRRLMRAEAVGEMGEIAATERRAAVLTEAYMDSKALEAWMAERVARRGEALPTAVWKALKARREERAKGKATNWLRD